MRNGNLKSSASEAICYCPLQRLDLHAKDKGYRKVQVVPGVMFNGEKPLNLKLIGEGPEAPVTRYLTAISPLKVYTNLVTSTQTSDQLRMYMHGYA